MVPHDDAVQRAYSLGFVIGLWIGAMLVLALAVVLLVLRVCQ